tara:strand:+ start:11145 stop:11363 length:219 start_codon:yes stop_codon:yes gene_type:complete
VNNQERLFIVKQAINIRPAFRLTRPPSLLSQIKQNPKINAKFQDLLKQKLLKKIDENQFKQGLDDLDFELNA